ncbi:N-alpha-acetyltransferase, non-catalitic subunit [Coemansia sp. RSA 1939]|nr:N-alpha-acetyltransferase, non-catalitic subunit [Coemansia sp. RSA 1939]KAJ2616837.1 N-alpha-acetyltransferase, non-catalitic subunit [Coemansia sp. RSA 1804]
MLVDADDGFTDWIDITNKLAAGAKQLKVGELLKPDSLTLFDAMVAVQVMDPRLDMGMLTAEDKAEIALWDFNKRLTLTDTLWIIDRMFSCEMTLHNSAALLQTIYTCNYFTVDENQIPRATIGSKSEGVCENPARDLVLYPVLIAVGACCARVWREYQNDNLYPDEDVHSGVVVPRFFTEYSLRDVHRLLESAREYLQGVIAGEEDAETQKRAAGVLVEQIGIRDGWLRVLEDLSAETLAEDPGALRRGMERLRSLAALHKRYVEGSGRAAAAAESALATPVRGAFDSKCMRRYPTLSPVRPRELLTRDEAHAAFARMLDDTAQVDELLAIESVERMIHFFLRFSRRSPTPVPFVRSLVMSAFATNGRVQLAQQSAAGLVRRAVSELGGSYVWATLETARGAAGIDARERADAFCTEAAGLLVCWLKSLCQNPPRQRRIALKSIGGWDALQADGEQLDMAVFALTNPQQPPAAAADPETNVFALSSWAYHMKLLAMETALLAGVRLEVYLDYEFAQVFCYAAQVFDAHQAHMERVARVAALQPSSRQNPQLQMQTLPWTARAVGSDECLAQIERWHVLAGAQKDLATALWLVSHVSGRLGVFRAPWEQRTTRLALEISRQQQQSSRDMLGAQRARFALRFRAFAQLGSPAPPSFAGWLATSAQLDSHALGDLLLHAGNVAGEAKALLERSRRAAASGPAHALDEWDACFRPLYFVVLANAVALTKLRKRAPALTQMPQPLRISGDQALRYRSQAVGAALARQTGTEGGDHSNGSSQGNGSNQQSQPRTKSERRRRKGTGRQDQTNTSAAAAAAAAGVAQRWLDDAARLTKSEVKIAWSCTPSKHPDWPVFSFQ